jgi:hypothetical protein
MFERACKPNGKRHGGANRAVVRLERVTVARVDNPPSGDQLGLEQQLLQMRGFGEEANRFA